MRIVLIGEFDDFVAADSFDQLDNAELLIVEDDRDASAVIAEHEPGVVLIMADADASDPSTALITVASEITCPMLLVAEELNASVIALATKLGVADVIPAAANSEAVAFSISKAIALARRDVTRRSAIGKIVTFYASKGGVGTTTLATNAAAIFAQHEERVLLFDLDLSSGDSSLAIGITPKHSVVDLALCHGDLDASTVSRFVTRSKLGFDVLPAPFRFDQADMLNDVRLNEILGVLSSMYDRIVIDTPCDLSATMLTVLEHTDQLVLMASNDVAALRSAKVALQTLDLLSFPMDRCQILLNREGSDVQLDRSAVEKTLDMKIAFSVPSSKIAPHSLNCGVPLVISNAKSPIARAIRGVCEKFITNGSLSPARSRRKIFSRQREVATAAN